MQVKEKYKTVIHFADGTNEVIYGGRQVAKFIRAKFPNNYKFWIGPQGKRFDQKEY